VSIRFLTRISLRFLAALLGLGLLSYLVFRTGPGIVWKQVQAVGWGLALIIILGGFSQLIKTWAWRQTFTSDISGLSWRRSFGTQLVSDAMGQLGLAGKLIGEGVRVSLVRSAVPLASGISAGAIDGVLHSFTAALVTVLGISATLLIAPLSSTWRAYASLVAVILIAAMVFAVVAVARRWPLAGSAARAIARLPLLHNWLSSKQSVIDSAEQNLLTFHQEAPAAFWASLLLNLSWHLLAAMEVFVILRFMGARIAFGGAFILEGLTKVINLVGVFNPGNFGTYEGGSMLIAKILGVPGTAGLTLALCRRARIIFWAGIGALCMAMMNRPQLFNSHRAAHSLTR
jgi:hypothetical protein